MQRRFSMLILLSMLLALVLSACAQPEPMAPADAPAEEAADAEAAADDSSGEDVPTDPSEAVAGGVWTRATLSDASLLNPILYSDNVSFNVISNLFPALIGQNPVSGVPEPGGILLPAGAMAASWDVSDDGLIWTFHLRDDVTWSDGEAVDAGDFKFTYDAIASELVETPRKSNVEYIESIEVVDPLTVEITFSEVKCDALADLTLGWLPSHLYADDFSDIMENPMNDEPAVSAGPLVFQSWARDDNIILARNETYADGAPNMEGMIWRVVPDAGARLAQLQSGEVDFIAAQPEQVASVDADANVERFNFKDDGYAYIGLNLANPENAMPGVDEEGNFIEQDPHPILSDHAVRLAIAHSLDYDTIIENVYLGQGYQIASNVLPAVEWAHDPAIEPYAYDPELAAQILDEAGWVDEDGDGVREKDGEPLELGLMTNAGNTTREDLGVLVQDQLGKVGFQINFEAIDFGTVVDNLLGQTFDMVIIGWTGLGSDPNDDGFWHSKFDTPGSGFNFVSYQNERMDELLEQGVSVPGCVPEDRAPFYQEIQQMIHDDIPYVFVTGTVGNNAYSVDWEGLDPGSWSFYWNLNEWYDTALTE